MGGIFVKSGIAGIESGIAGTESGIDIWSRKNSALFFDTSSKDGIFMRGRRGGIMGQHTIDIKVYKETDANDSGTDNSSFGTDLINGGEGSGGCNKYNGSENDATVARKTLRKSAKLDG